MKLNDNERKVLTFLADQFSASYMTYWGFDGIKQHVPELDRKTIRRSCRSLARKGLAEFMRGLWNYEGPAGAGYGATRAGVELVRTPDEQNSKIIRKVFALTAAAEAGEPIHIDKKKFDSPNPTTGSALYTLGQIPAGYDLWREVHGKGDDERIPNGATQIVLKDGDIFYSVQSSLNPGIKLWKTSPN